MSEYKAILIFFFFFTENHVDGFLSLEYWIKQDKMSMRFITPTSLNSNANSIQIVKKLCEIIRAAVFAFWH